jgi:DNA-binding NtrC family response regulator/tetratricopeptide (TPR) repeat protein
MQEPGTTTSATLGRRGDAHWARARGSLALGRHAEALEAVRRARRYRSAVEGPLLALAEGDALLGLQRYREVVGVATRALRGPLEPDLKARLRVLRGHGLWLTGRVATGGGEVRRAAAEARAPLTRGRVHEALALFAWKGQELDKAADHLRLAHAAYAEGGSPAAVARLLAKEAGVLRDAGRLDEALVVQDRRLHAAMAGGRPDLVAEARADRAGLFTALGRWADAEQELDAADGIFARIGDGREIATAGLVRVVVDLARGDLPRARATLDRAREWMADRGHVRGLAETLLLTSDLHLAARQPADADRTALESLDLYRVVRDREGQCRSRIRRTHALLEAGRVDDAAAEARHALARAAASRPDLVALAHLALGRALLRAGDKAAAAASFDRAAVLAATRPAFAHAAALGRAVAAGRDRDDADVRAAVEGLEAWGDRRVLASCLGDLAELAPRPAVPIVRETAPVEEIPSGLVLADAAAALLGEEAWDERWAAAMAALRGALPWWRAALVTAERGLELRGDLDRAVPLPARDLARDLTASGAWGVTRLDDGAWAAHPTRVLHDLAFAILAPVGADAALYVDIRTPSALPQDAASLVRHLARLLACRPPDLRPAAEERLAFPGIVGGCPALRTLLATVARVAPSDLTVHVSGETGTGKEALAKALHARSGRSRGPFVAVNASSLGDELFETEMFGHGRGAFTGAVGERDGYVAAAEGGTLFLDEVADLTPRAQARLLRFLEEREYRRVGETRVRRANIRVVSAANASLSCRLRPDVVFRLEEIVLTLPPLRERGADLWLLTRHFLAEAAEAAGLPLPTLSGDARRALAAHGWPGNVRELRREIRRAVILAAGPTIRREHLSEALRAPSPAPTRTLRDALMAFEREHVARELGRYSGHRVRTATALGITRQALAAKMARLGL